MQIGEYKTIVGIIKKAIRSDIKSGRNEKNNYRIHASSMYDFCPYRLYIANNENLSYSPEQLLDTGRALTFKIGRKIQDIIVESVLSYAPAHILARWFCPKCKEESYGTGEYRICKTCQIEMIYEEIALEYPIEGTKYYISGSVDCFIAGNSLYTPVEIKGLRKEDFEGEPIIKYEIQAGIYNWLVKNSPIVKKFEKMGYKFNKEGSILLYVSKQHSQKPIRGFIVKNKKSVDNIIKQVIEDIHNMEAGKPRKICTSSASFIAKNCPFKDLCWR